MRIVSLYNIEDALCFDDKVNVSRIKSEKSNLKMIKVTLTYILKNQDLSSSDLLRESFLAI
jgi:hypothetical protein